MCSFQSRWHFGEVFCILVLFDKFEIVRRKLVYITYMYTREIWAVIVFTQHGYL